MDGTKLISFDDYQKIQHARPYTFIHHDKGQVIYFFGSKHSYDPNDEQFPILDSFWNDFLEETESKKRLAFEEGGIRPLIDDKDGAIIRHGEMGYLTYLATKAGITIVSPEPPQGFAMNELAKHFSKEVVLYYDAARMMYQWNNMNIKPDYEIFLQDDLDYLKGESGWDDIEFTVDTIKTIHEKLFGNKFNENDKQFFYNVINPTTKFSIINEVSRYEDDEFRERYILNQFEKYWREGDSIFAVYGSSHAVRQEPAIKTLT